MNIQLEHIYGVRPTGADWITSLSNTSTVNEAAEVFLYFSKVQLPVLIALQMKYYTIRLLKISITEKQKREEVMPRHTFGIFAR